MKKILCYLAVGAVALGTISCVKDQESASVTAVRQAKAAQLLSVADLNKAQAEAANITANAEAALMAAQAEYQKAQAEYQKALAEYQKALADKTGAEADAIREKMKQDQERFQMEKQKILIEIERIRAEADAQIAAYRLSIKKLEQEIADLADERVKKLFAEYSSLVSDLSAERTRLLGEQTLKIKAESDLVSLQAAASETETEYNNRIAGRQAYIEMLKAHMEHQPDRATLEPLLRAKAEEYEEQAYKFDQNEAKAYEQSEDNLMMKYEDSNAISPYIYSWYGMNVYIPLVSSLYDLNVVARMNVDDGSEPTHIRGYSNLFSFQVPATNSALIEKAKFELEKEIRYDKEWVGKEGDDRTYENTLHAWLKFCEETLEKREKELAEKADALEKAKKAKADAKQAHIDAVAAHDKAHAALEAAQEAYDKAVKAEAEAQAAYDAESDPAKKAELQKALDAAKKAAADAATALGKARDADDAAQKAEDDALTKSQEVYNAYSDAVTEYEDAQERKITAEKLVIAYRDEIAFYNKRIAKNEALYNNFDNAVAEALAEQQAFVKEMLELVDIRDKALAAYYEASKALGILREEVKALQELYNAATYESYAESIAYAEADITRFEQYIKDAKNAASSKEESIKLIEKRIADIEARIKVLETLVDNAKKELDAALAA